MASDAADFARRAADVIDGHTENLMQFFYDRQVCEGDLLSRELTLGIATLDPASQIARHRS